MTQRIHSLYLSEEEEDAVRQVARLNGTSVNFVARAAIRTLLGLPAARLELPEHETAAVESHR